jgi:hypothetical protein
MPSTVAMKTAVLTFVLVGTAAAFVLGAQAGALLNGRVMAVSVARVPMPALAPPKGTDLHLR